MNDLNLAAAVAFDAEHERRLHCLRQRYPELFGPDSPPAEHVLVDLGPFIFDKPQQFYSEPVFEVAYGYLTQYYQRHPSDLITHFEATSEEVRRGASATAYFARDITDNVPQGVDRRARVLRYWAPWYVNLEVCLKETCSPWYWAVARERPNHKGTLEDAKYMTDRKSTLDTVSALTIFTDHFDGTVRNACAHRGITVSRESDIRPSDMIVFRGARGAAPVEWSEDEFELHLHGMLDTCNALVLATRLFVLRNWGTLSPLFSFTSLPPEEREPYFLVAADTPSIRVSSADVLPMAPSQQVTIQATDTALITEELQFDALAVLSRAARFYPDVGSVFLGLKGRRHWPSWVRGPMPPLRAWAEGDASLQEYVNTPSVEFVLFPMTGRIPYPIAHRLPRLPQVRQMAALRRGWSLVWPRYRARIQEAQRARREQPWRVLDVRDMSIGIAKRLDVLVVIPEGMSRTEIAPILEHVSNYVRTQRYRTKENRSYKRKYRKHFARRRPAYVWLQVFTKEKRPSDMWSNRDASFFVCRTEWFDNTYRARGLSPILRLPETVTGTDITVEWSPQYPAAQAEANASI